VRPTGRDSRVSLRESGYDSSPSAESGSQSASSPSPGPGSTGVGAFSSRVVSRETRGAGGSGVPRRASPSGPCSTRRSMIPPDSSASVELAGSRETNPGQATPTAVTCGAAPSQPARVETAACGVDVRSTTPSRRSVRASPSTVPARTACRTWRLSSGTERARVRIRAGVAPGGRIHTVEGDPFVGRTGPSQAFTSAGRPPVGPPQTLHDNPPLNVLGVVPTARAPTPGHGRLAAGHPSDPSTRHPSGLIAAPSRSCRRPAGAPPPRAGGRYDATWTDGAGTCLH
jgi:hypothetical protein